MSYTKQTWTTGDTITAEKLNHIEDGISNVDSGESGGGENNIFIVNATAVNNDDTWTVTADASWTDITSAYNSNKAVILKGVINPNDGRPEPAYLRKEFIIGKYATQSEVEFISSDVFSGTLMRYVFTIGIDNVWQYSQISYSFSS